MVNIDLVKMILDQLGKPHSLISFVPDRLGHDRRYAIDSSFAQRELDWNPLPQFQRRPRGDYSVVRRQSDPGGNRCSSAPVDINAGFAFTERSIGHQRSEQMKIVILGAGGRLGAALDARISREI